MFSSGWYEESKLVILELNLTSCEYEEVFTQYLDSAEFGEGIALVQDQMVY